MYNVANKMINIESDIEYNSISEIIFSIQATKTNMSDVLIVFDDSEIIVPAGGFVRGHIYPISFKKILFDKNDCGFIGYVFKSKI